MPPIQLTRLVLVGIGGDGITRALEICQDERVLFHAELDTCDAVGAVTPAGVKCRGDLIVRVLIVRELEDGETSEAPDLQVCFHSAFVHDGFVRFPAREIDDLSGSLVGGECAIDVFFKTVDEGDAEDTQDSLAAASAAAAVAGGLGIPVFSGPEIGDAAETAEASPEHPPAVAVFDMAASDSPKLVFKPDDIDAFFADM